MKKSRKEEKPYRFVSHFIFFLNVFISLMIIGWSWILVETLFGQTAVIFGFFMLSISVVLKIVARW